MNFKTLIFSLFVLSLMACDTSTKQVDTNDGKESLSEDSLASVEENHEFSIEYFNGDDYIVYENLGQPLPPPVYKKYQFKIGINQIALTISNYKEVIATEKKDLTQEQLSSIIEKIKSSRLVQCDNIPAEGCTGGASENLNYKIGNVIFSGNAYSCGGKQYGNICGKPEELDDFLKTLFPNFEELMMP